MILLLSLYFLLQQSYDWDFYFDGCREGDGNFLFGPEVSSAPVREGVLCDVKLFEVIII